MEDELTLDIIEQARKVLEDTHMDVNLFFIDGLSLRKIPEDVKDRIRWAFDHIYISEYLEEV